ncbi:2-oxo acid dehydrogenase subunit E2 [Candidatus Thorarchaeota archaeon]|nr:2-oxo acid dehydrogenase subunit E2 [Candidatus Thorarchaeota archaeon]TFG98976.1 MAG: 2-oxo acid dehydrogenase subunit E2 [Candidatus Thorarchaeota archaeon]
MVTTMIMQRMSVAMEYGVILKWLKKEGDNVKKGDLVVEIFGEKNEFELEAPDDGVILKILCDVNDEIPISEPIAYIGKEGEEIPDARPKKLNAVSTPAITPTAAAVTPTQVSKAVTPQTTSPSTESRLPDGKIKASPRAKKKAKELGIDLSIVVGTGQEGRIIEKDVIGAKDSAPQVSQVSLSDERKVRKVEPMTPLRRTIARRMTQSAQNPHITMITEIDMTEAVALRKELNLRVEKAHGIRVSFNDIIVKAVADTLERFPKFNATLVGNELHMFDDVNIGVAIATDNGLIVVTIREANKKSITDIAIETKEKGKRAKMNKLAPEELTGSTFTVSNLGPFNVDLFIPVINPPETAILALGQIKKKPVVIDDAIAIRSMMMASCAVDHRILDGAPAGQFLATLKETLENPFMMKM